MKLRRLRRFRNRLLAWREAKPFDFGQHAHWKPMKPDAKMFPNVGNAATLINHQ